jgi:heterotetrameric sarcosine oxidase gamma subunit
MTPKGLDIVIDAPARPTRVELMPSAALIAFELWGGGDPGVSRIGRMLGGALPELRRSADMAGGWRAIRLEPTVWWLSGPFADLDSQFARLEAMLGDQGAATDLSGAFVCIAVAGPAWRKVLMIGGVFDAEDPTFGPGSTAGTILHRVGVRHDVVARDHVNVYVAPSYAEHLLTLLRASARREPTGEEER